MTPTSDDSVSVALCTHNGASFIEEQLLSILAQIQLPDEIVVSDDASTDATVDIVSSVFSKWSSEHDDHVVKFVILTNTEPLGVARNFENAVRHCTGALIALCDQDDIWHPDRISAATPLMNQPARLDLLFADAALVDTVGISLGENLLDALEVSAVDRQRVHEGDAFSILIRRNIATGATVVFRASLLAAALPFPTGWIHDEWLAIIAAAVGSVDLIDKPLIDYRQHASNQIGVSQPSLRRKAQRMLQRRGDRNNVLAQKFRVLVDRLASLPGLNSGAVLTHAETKAVVEEFRAALPHNRVARLPPIFLAAWRGWYHTYCSRGNMDILRDLLQSHR